MKQTVTVPKPGAVIAAFGSVWVQDREDGAVWRINRYGHVIAKIPNVIRSKRLGWESQTLGAGFGSVWALGDGSVARIDPQTDEPTTTIAVPDYAYALGVGAGGVWVACCAGGPPGSGVWPRLLRIDPTTERVGVFARMGTSPSAFAVGNGSVWWGDFSEAGGVERIDASNGERVRIEASNMQFIVPTPRWIWLLENGLAQRLAAGSDAPAIDSGRKAPISIGAAYADGVVWINAGGAIGFDAKTGKVAVHLDLHPQPYQAIGGIAKLGSWIWAADSTGGRIVGVSLLP
jgi:hypothetical protein